MSTKQADLTSVISDVIENLAMMVVEPLPADQAFEPQLQGWIEFTGPVNGKFAIRCGEPLALSLAANLLGTENLDIQTQANAGDALAELLNIICGNLVTALFDSEKPFTLSVPQINIIPAEEFNDNSTGNDVSQTKWPENANRQTTKLLLDGHAAEFTLTVEQTK